MAMNSAKGTAACCQSVKKPARPLGGTLDTVPVLRFFLKNTKGTAACRQSVKNVLRPLGETCDAVPVLDVFRKKLTAREIHAQ
jgi:hypothetical protein